MKQELTFSIRISSKKCLLSVKNYLTLYTMLPPSGQVGIALDETIEKQDLDDLFWVFNCRNLTADKVMKLLLRMMY